MKRRSLLILAAISAPRRHLRGSASHCESPVPATTERFLSAALAPESAGIPRTPKASPVPQPVRQSRSVWSAAYSAALTWTLSMSPPVGGAAQTCTCSPEPVFGKMAPHHEFDFEYRQVRRDSYRSTKLPLTQTARMASGPLPLKNLS
jgi:hypothetical protein